MPERQRYRLRARSDREVIREVEPGAVYVDRDSGEEFEVVGKLLPLAPSPSNLPWAVENLRLCGCSLEQRRHRLVPDAEHYTVGRRAGALERDRWLRGQYYNALVRRHGAGQVQPVLPRKPRRVLRRLQTFALRRPRVSPYYRYGIDPASLQSSVFGG